MSGIGILLSLTGLFVHSLAGLAWCSPRVRAAVPLRAESSPLVLTVIGLVCEAIGLLLLSLCKS